MEDVKWHPELKKIIPRTKVCMWNLQLQMEEEIWIKGLIKKNINEFFDMSLGI